MFRITIIECLLMMCSVNSREFSGRELEREGDGDRRVDNTVNSRELEHERLGRT